MKALLFDADGVVITPPMSFGAHFQRERNIDASHMNTFYSGIFQECVRGKHDMKGVLPEWLKHW
jgi:putative hydrolase of the HAD superfamily